MALVKQNNRREFVALTIKNREQRAKSRTNQSVKNNGSTLVG